MLCLGGVRFQQLLRIDEHGADGLQLHASFGQPITQHMDQCVAIGSAGAVINQLSIVEMLDAVIGKVWLRFLDLGHMACDANKRLSTP